MSKEQALLKSYNLNGLELPNRVVMAPMTRSRADNPENTPIVIKINKLLADDMCKYTITACDGSVQTFKLNGDDFYSKDDRKVRVDMCRTANRLGDFNKNDEKPCFN